MRDKILSNRVSQETLDLLDLFVCEVNFNSSFYYNKSRSDIITSLLYYLKSLPKNERLEILLKNIYQS